MNCLYFFPGLDILTRRIDYEYLSSESTNYINEELTFKNNSNKEIQEIIIEIESFRYDLKIVDRFDRKILYLPKPSIINKIREIDSTNYKLIEDIENDRVYLLYFYLNEPLLPGEIESLYMTYATKTEKYNKFISSVERSFWVLKFYDKETLTVSESWKGKLENVYPYMPLGVKETCDKSMNNVVYLKDKNFHWAETENNFHYSVSYQTKSEYNIDYIVHNSKLSPEQSERYLVGSLIIFSILLPFTLLFLLFKHINNISYSLDITEIEVVLFLTLGFTEFYRQLINIRRYIFIAVILAGVMFSLTFISFYFNILF